MLREPQYNILICQSEALEAFKILSEVLENYFR